MSIDVEQFASAFAESERLARSAAAEAYGRKRRVMRQPKKQDLRDGIAERDGTIARKDLEIERLRAENETLRGQRVSPHLPEAMPSCPPPAKRAMRENAPDATRWPSALR